MRRLDLITAIRTTITIALGGIGASAGFTHTHDWANAHGQHGWLAWADAVVIEGMAIVAGFEIHRDHAAHRTGRTALLPQLVLAVAFLIQMTAQVAQAEPTPAGWLLAAMPALGFLIVVKLAMRHIPTDQHTRDEATPTISCAPNPPTTPARSTLGTLARLPVNVRQSVTDTVAQAHADGRSVTAQDIRATIALPDAMLTELVTELNATINNHVVDKGQSIEVKRKPGVRRDY